jgi:hypothetical protein
VKVNFATQRPSHLPSGSTSKESVKASSTSTAPPYAGGAVGDPVHS